MQQMRLFPILILLSPFWAHGAELSFKVNVPDNPAKEYQVLLDAFDAFTYVSNSESPSGVVLVDISEKVLTVRHLGVKSKKEMVDALFLAFIEISGRRQDDEVEKLRTHLEQIMQEIQSERDMQRLKIIKQIYQASMPSFGTPRPPFPIKLVN